MRMKQLVSIITATALCLPTYGIWAAYGTGEFNGETRNYIYSNGYDKSAEKGNLGYDMKLIDDPTDSSNKIMQVYEHVIIGTRKEKPVDTGVSELVPFSFS